MPSSYHRNYADSVSAIYRDMGRAKAEARLQQGQGWGNAISKIGQTIANIPGQLQEQQQRDQRIKLTDMQIAEATSNIERAKAKDAQDMVIADLISAASPNGELDQDAFKSAAAAQGLGHLVPAALKPFMEMDQALLEFENAQKQGLLTDSKLVEMRENFLRPVALTLWENQFDPKAVNAAWAVLRSKGVPDELVKELEALKPHELVYRVQELLPQAKAPEAVTLSKDQVRDTPKVDQYGRPVMGADGQTVIIRTEGNQTPQTLEQQFAAATTGADRSRIAQRMREEAAAKRAPQTAPQPNYQRIETVDEAGNPVIRFMTPEEVRAQGGIKTSPKTTAKASGPATVNAILGEIQTLSEKINTSSGGPMSNITGAVRRGKASMNLDNEVSEYQALVEGFIPMIARAVGHTGVLTQMDVESVRQLFPKVGDNQTLSTNKLDRVKRIMTAMQDPSVAALGPDATFADKLNAALGVMNKPTGGRASGAGPASGPLSAAELLKKYGGG